jgi:hypothetical protein
MSLKSKKPKLTIELIPKTCHFSSVRTMVTPKEWDKIRFISYEKAKHKCQICGDNGINQGYKHRVECHEIWDYDDTNKVQKLVGLISLCVICHQVKHIGRAMAIGKKKETYDQLAKVNKWTPEDIQRHIDESFELYKERSKHEWTLDISLLSSEPYEIKLKKTTKRKFKVKKYRKRRKLKTATKKVTVLRKKPTKRPPKKLK